MADIEQLFDTLLSLQQQKRLPPLEQWQPDKRGEVDIRIDRDGRWFHEGDQIKRQPLIDLFATLLRKEGCLFFGDPGRANAHRGGGLTVSRH